MTLLAIDTSESACSVALLAADTVVDSRSEIIGRGHAERLLPLIEETLVSAGLGYSDLSRIVVTTGPGTFTGLRIGLAVARGLALQGDLPCIGLTGLQVLAAQAWAQTNPASVAVHAVITGRGGQAFYQCFEGTGDDGIPAATEAAAGLDAQDIAKAVLSRGGVVIGSGVSLLRDGNFIGEGSSAAAVDLIDVPYIDPAALGQLGQIADPELYPPEPTYFRAADAKKATPILPVASG